MKHLHDGEIAHETHVLAHAEAILRRRFERQGAIQDPEQAGRFFRVRLAHLEHEEFHVAFLDTRHRIIAVECLAIGTVDGAEVHPREVVKGALRHNAAAVLLAHNHPSGDPTPSAADRAITQHLKDALALVDVRVLDHLVVGESVVSLAQRGWV
jgi:DNA repair protein RadC